MKKVSKVTAVLAIFLFFILFSTNIVNAQEESDLARSEAAESRAPKVEAKKLEELPELVKEEEPKEPVEKIEIKVDPALIDKEIPLYKTDLKQIVFEAEQSIKKIDEKLKSEENDKAAREHFDKGSALYSEKKYDEAKSEWESALKVAATPSMRGAIKNCIKRAEYQIKVDRDCAAEAARKAAAVKACQAREMEKQRCQAERQAQQRQREVAAAARKAKLEQERQQREIQRKAKCSGASNNMKK